MEDLNARIRRETAQPLPDDSWMHPARSTPVKPAPDPEPTLTAPLEAGLRLLASLLDQGAGPDDGSDTVIDLELGGYRWTVRRCLPSAPGTDHRLSPREAEITRMVALGRTNRAIASALDISPWTVSTHLRRIFCKLEVNSRAAMVAQAIELGLHSGPNGTVNGDTSV